MKTKLVFLSLALVSAAILAGCSHAPLSNDFRTSTSNNITVQTINPNAGKGNVPMATLDGKKGEAALTRYRADSGAAPASATTSSSSTSN